MNISKAKIGNALTSVAPDHVVAVSADIYDETLDRYQSDINADVSKRLIQVFYNDLVEMRDSSKLIPGQKYRIVDYITTTKQVNTESAKHNFDIIVEAISENTLSENAYACRCFNSKRDHGIEINSDIFNYTEENDWYEYGHSYGGPTLPDDVLTLKNESGIDIVSTDYVKIQISDVNQYLDKIFRITLQGTDVNGNKIRGFGATLIKTGVIQDFDFGFRDEFYLRLPESATAGEYVLRLYAVGTQSEMSGGEVGARAEVFDSISYFNDSDLNAWEIKYSLDNDTNRFAWADTVNGKGVIYRMIDEWGNDCPYDFKNILYSGKYTFNYLDSSTNNNMDLTLNNLISDYRSCVENIIKPLYHALNFIIIETTERRFVCNNNIFDLDSSYNNFTLLNSCCNNQFGKNFSHNSFTGSYCNNNIFGDSCNNNKISGEFYKNTIGNECENINFNSNFGYNTIGYKCRDINFGYDCNYNTIGNNCRNINFGNFYSYNIIGNNCNGVDFLRDINSLSRLDYVSNTIIGDNCYSLRLYKDVLTDVGLLLRNFKISPGMTGDIELVGDVLNRNYITTISFNSKNEVVQYCEADLLNTRNISVDNEILKI